VKQYEIEYNYIMSKYFNNFQILSSLKKVKDRPANKCDVLIGNREYEFYKYDSGEIILIPKIDNLFEGDFDDVYRLLFVKDSGIHFSIMRKQNGTIENFYYDFMLNNTLYSDSDGEVLLKYYSMEDNKNILYKTYKEDNISLELFLIRYKVNKLKSPRKEKIIAVRKNINGDSEKCIYDSIVSSFDDYINKKTNFQKIDVGENESLISLAQSIIEDNKYINNLNVNSGEENKKILRKIFC